MRGDGRAARADGTGVGVRRPRGLHARRRAALALVLTLAAVGCTTPLPEAPAARRLYFEPLLPPVGIGATMVRDESELRPEGGVISVALAVESDLDQGELQRLLEALWRQVEARRGFGAPDRGASRIELRCYASAEAARRGGDDWLGRAAREGLRGAPTFANRQVLPLLRLATEALGRQPQYSGVLRPELLADPEARSVEVSLPFVRDDGSGAAVERVSFERATTTLTATLAALFGKVPQLAEVTFVGRHRGRVVLRVRVSREQYAALKLLEIEEQLGALRGQLIGALASGRLTDATAQGELALRRRERYQQALRRLPAGRVFIAPTLR